MKRFALFLAALSTLLFVACQSGTIRGPAPVERDSPSEDLSLAPTSTPYTARPEIKNRAIVARAIEWEYPRILRIQGIGGTINVWFWVAPVFSTRAYESMSTAFPSSGGSRTSPATQGSGTSSVSEAANSAGV